MPTMYSSALWKLMLCLASVASVASAWLFDGLLLFPRQAPANATGVKTITSPGGVTIRYTEPGSVCESTPGVNSYSGYVDLDQNTHMFFWFFEARHNPANAPLTLWLNGGPGSDSLIGLFQELGPCNVTQDLKPQLNPYSWSEVSNMLFISQPIGVGFSYSYEQANSSGRYAYINAGAAVNTTDQAAVVTWHVLQAFLTNLPSLDPGLNSSAPRLFNLWTESYGGHYGPSFYSYFSAQNALIAAHTINGTLLTFDTLGIGNGIISEAVQAPYYPEFAVNNTYGIRAVNDSVYLFMKESFSGSGMCSDLLAACAAANRASNKGQIICAKAAGFCRSNVEGPYYAVSGRSPYDIRSFNYLPPTYFPSYLNLAPVQQALGVNINYTTDSSGAVAYDFELTGDFAFPDFLTDLENLLNNGVRVALYAGDADYICNWFGGEAVSLQVNYVHANQFRAAGYAPFVVGGTEYGEVRQYGNFSFLRVYESGHEVPYYQPAASLEFFRRVLAGKAISDGVSNVIANYGTNGTENATHVESTMAATTAAASLPTVLPGTATGTQTAQGTAKPSASASSGAQRRVSLPWRLPWWVSHA